MWGLIFLLLLHGHECQVQRSGLASRERRAPKLIHQCSTDSDCPLEDLPNWDDSFGKEERKIEMYRCKFDYERGDGTKTCQTRHVPFCSHPEARSHEKCEIEKEEQVYELNDRGRIVCNTDSDCPPTTAPEWDGVTSITTLSIQESYCSDGPDYPDYDYWTSAGSGSGSGSGSTPITSPPNRLCFLRDENFCDHELGRNHPECQRCNVLFPLPDPPCIRLDLRVDVDECCKYFFNTSSYDDKWLSDVDVDFRQEIQSNFTMKDCQLTGFHQPPNTPPRTSFDKSICCEFDLCFNRPFSSGGTPPHTLSTVAGTGILAKSSLASRTPSCPSFFCKRPSLASPGKIICCPLIRRRWGNARIPVCPNSCD